MPASTFKIILYHFSDTHWIPLRYISKRSRILGEKSQECSDGIRFLADLKAEYAPSKDSDEVKHILVHTGDIITHEDGIKETHRECLKIAQEEFLRPLQQKLNTNLKLAVPGNHDVYRKVSSKKRLEDFDNVLSEEGWETPNSLDRKAKPPFVTVTDSNGKIRATIWLINSTKYLGGVQVDTRDLDAYSKAIASTPTDALRIALLHHNPLPAYGQFQGKEVFINCGSFNQFLVTNNIKLLLCGHQHISNEAFFAIPGPLRIADKASQLARPYMETGFLALFGRGFPRHERGTANGFNKLEIEFPVGSSIATVEVTKFVATKESHPNGLRIDTDDAPRKYALLVKRLSDLGVEVGDCERRIKLVRKAIDVIYKRGVSLGPLERVLNIEQQSTHISNLRTKLQTRDVTSIRGVYSLGIFPPDSWWAHRLTISFRRVYGEHSSKAKDNCGNEVSGILQVGPSLQRTLNTSLKASEYLKPTESVKLEEKTHDEELYIKHVQLTAGPLESASSLARKLASGAIITKPSAQKIVGSSGLEARKRMEIARIALWKREFFSASYAADVLQFHDDFLVPFFWLEPTRLQGRLVGSERLTRSEFGVISLVSSSKNGSGKFDVELTYNDMLGRELTTPYSESAMEALWGGKDRIPFQLSNCITKEDCGMAEIYALLQRPDIMFAADAWMMLRSSREEELNQYFTTVESSCAEWAFQ